MKKSFMIFVTGMLAGFLIKNELEMISLSKEISHDIEELRKVLTTVE